MLPLFGEKCLRCPFLLYLEHAYGARLCTATLDTHVIRGAVLLVCVVRLEDVNQQASPQNV